MKVDDISFEQLRDMYMAARLNPELEDMILKAYEYHVLTQEQKSYPKMTPQASLLLDQMRRKKVVY